MRVTLRRVSSSPRDCMTLRPNLARCRTVGPISLLQLYQELPPAAGPHQTLAQRPLLDPAQHETEPRQHEDVPHPAAVTHAVVAAQAEASSLRQAGWR